MHLYQCPECCAQFVGDDSYDDCPQTRLCRLCGGAQGNIMYIGNLGSTPNVISDHLDGVVNPVDGKRYGSKAEYYKTVDKAGCYINDGPVNTERKTIPKDTTRKQDVADVIFGRRPIADMEQLRHIERTTRPQER